MKQDKAKAVEMYLQAHKAGHASATYNLGVMYDQGKGVAKDKAKASES